MKTVFSFVLCVFFISVLYGGTKYSIKKSGSKQIVIQTFDTTYTNNAKNGEEVVSLTRKTSVDTLSVDKEIPDSVVLKMYLSGVKRVLFLEKWESQYTLSSLLTKKTTYLTRSTAVKNGSVIKVEKSTEKIERGVVPGRVLFVIFIFLLVMITTWKWNFQKRIIDNKIFLGISILAIVLVGIAPFFFDYMDTASSVGVAFFFCMLGFASIIFRSKGNRLGGLFISLLLTLLYLNSSSPHDAAVIYIILILMFSIAFIAVTALVNFE